MYNVSDITKILVIAPHPDDEMCGCGGMMIKYANQVDCLCISSSGLAYKDISAEDRAHIRINEFNSVMDSMGIARKWIFKIFGPNNMIPLIKRHFVDYWKILRANKYDIIFMPHPKDHHKEHRFVTNVLMKLLLLSTGFKLNCRIAFYEVWSPIAHPNYFLDISDVSLRKKELLKLYKSQHVLINYAERVSALNVYRGMMANNVDSAEAFQIVSIFKYLFLSFLC